MTYLHPSGYVFPLTLDSLASALHLSNTQARFYFGCCELHDRNLRVWGHPEWFQGQQERWAEAGRGDITVTVIEPPKETLLKPKYDKPSLFKDRPAPRLDGMR